MGPVLPLKGTVAVILVSELTVKVAAVPLKVRLVAPVKLFPLIATDEPAAPFTGEKPVITGGTKKLLVVVKVPTVIGPVVTLVGAVARI